MPNSFRNFLLTTLILLGLPLMSVAQKPVWIDTDMLFGKMRKDVDDGLALMMSLGNDSIKIVGISLIDKVDYGHKITNDFLKWYGRGDNIPVYKGANSPFEMGEKTDAVKGLAAALRKQKLTVVGLGPVTNIATTLQLYPELKDSVERIVLCMGRQPDSHFNPGNGRKNLNDYNFDLAPESAEFLIAANVPIVLCGYGAASRVYLNHRDYKFLRKDGKYYGKKIYRRLRIWELGWKLVLGSKKGFIPFDAVTLSYVLQPDLLETYPDLPAETKMMKNDTHYRNLGDQKKYLLAAKEINSDNSVIFCYQAKAGLKEYILKSLLITVRRYSTRKYAESLRVPQH